MTPETTAAPQDHAPHTGGRPAEDRAATEAVADLMAQLSELRQRAALMVQVSADRARLRMRRLAVVVGVYLFVGVAFVCLVASAMRLLVLGVGGGINALLGGPPWLGDCVAGAALLLAVVFIGRMVLARGVAARHRELVQRYERQDST